MQIQTPMIISNMEGSLNGSTVRRSRYGLVLQRKASGLQSNTTALGLRRSKFASVANAWTQLSPPNKLQWQYYSEFNPQTDRFGNPIILSAYAYFVKVQNFLLTVNASFVTTADYDPKTDNIINFTVSQISTNVFQASVDLDDLNYPTRAVVFAVRVPTGSNSPFLNYRQFVRVNSVSGTNITQNITIATAQTPIKEQWYLGCFIVTENGGVSPTVLAKADW